MIDNKEKKSERYFLTSVFRKVLTVFTNLSYLNCHPFVEPHLPRFAFMEDTPTFFSSTLTELHINVFNFDDILYLLDGCLNQLHTFYVNIEFLCVRNGSTIYKKVNYYRRSK
jgi:hypothetical protein